MSRFLHPGRLGGHGGSGGGSTYVAKAVSLDNATWLDCSSLTATDGRYCTFSVWVTFNNPAMSAPPGTIWVTDAQNLYTSNFAGGASGAQLHLSGAFADTSGADTANFDTISAFSPTGLAIDTWYNFLVSVDTEAQISYSFVNDMDLNYGPFNGGPFDMLFNGLEMTVGGDTFSGDGWLGKMADFQFFPGVFVDLDDVDKRRLFIDESGKPVDPAVARAALGTPAVLFQRTTDPLSFGDNQGNGGTFTWTGTPGDGGTVT